MPRSWTTSAGELLLAVDRSSPRKGEQLRLTLRDAIADGVLAPGTRLPSTRALAQDLDVSRGLVVEVYEQLTAEGWLQARQGSGTVVATHRAVARPRVSEPLERRPVATLDLRPARPDVTSFPRTAWVAATRAVLADLPHHDLSYGDHRGHQHVREVFAAYLARVRGVGASPELMVITDGFSSGLTSVVSTLAGRGVDRIAVEDPGGYEPRRRLQAAGAKLIPVPVDDEGLLVDELERSDAQAVLVTPAHQYPMGSVLSAARRAALVEWARRGGNWIIEDDYDAEFRYDREPIGAVHGLAPERTIHIGSVAKTLAPSVRVGWLVVPEEFLAPLVTAHETRVSQPGTLEQLVLARLVEDGHYDRHLRRVRRTYRERRNVLVDTLADAGLDDRIEGVAAGMQAVLRLDDRADDSAIVDQLHQQGVEVVALSRYTIRSPARGLVIGFGQASPPQLRQAATITAEVLGRHLGRGVRPYGPTQTRRSRG
jgi:GntR family transcriptional regulator / MocR family aminotransferase